MIKITMMGDWKLQKKMNTIKITTTKLGPHLMTITKRRTMMEGGVGPTFECLSDEDHDEDLLHTITIACTIEGITNINFFNRRKQIYFKHH